MAPVAAQRREFYGNMEKLNSIHEMELSAEGFERFPIWVWDDEQKGHYPLSGSGALPTEFGTLFIRAAFTAGSGCQLNGYLIGIQTFYGFGLFINGQHYLINLNLPELAIPTLRAISIQLGNKEVLPLSYSVDILFEGQPPIKGVFEKI